MGALWALVKRRALCREQGGIWETIPVKKQPYISTAKLDVSQLPEPAPCLRVNATGGPLSQESWVIKK